MGHNVIVYISMIGNRDGYKSLSIEANYRILNTGEYSKCKK